jgi:cytochrome c-type biogenesis protein CcsB
VLAYLAAMIGYAAEYAFGEPQPLGARTRRRSSWSARARRSRPPTVPVGGRVRARPDRARWAGRIAVGLNALGLLLHLGALVTRGIAADRMPWGNMYEFILSVTFVGSAAGSACCSRRPAVRHLGLFVTLALVVLLGADGLIAYTPVGPLVPALHSYWFVIHVSTIILASGICCSARCRPRCSSSRPGTTRASAGSRTRSAARPGRGALERLTFRLHAFAFPLFTFGALIAGPLWAEASWGRYWGWDPKEVWAFISWIVYACYLHARATPSVKRTTATWIALLGFATMLMNLFGVNLFFSGLHSYANAGGM